MYVCMIFAEKTDLIFYRLVGFFPDSIDRVRLHDVTEDLKSNYCIVRLSFRFGRSHFLADHQWPIQFSHLVRAELVELLTLVRVRKLEKKEN